MSEYASKNFKWSELECHGVECQHCGIQLINQEAIDALQKLRDIIGNPFIITSAARCRKHNKSVGGAPHSKHLSYKEGDHIQESTAFDISLYYRNGQHSQSRLAMHARECGFNGIGLYNDFIHIDHKRTTPASWDMRD